jgi:hypothetical protein
MQQRRGAIAALGVAIALLAAIYVAATLLLQPPPKTETGVVVDIESVSLTEVRAFTLRTPDGRTVEFRIGQLENGAQFPPSHLAVHQVDATPVRVTYRDEGEERVAIRLEDAPAAPPS